ncbi:MAG: ABC transporter substrate-binding protein [Betaproteobacteria bacterium]|jgi:branched-chain amino acid transport system substrate-binding protein
MLRSTRRAALCGISAAALAFTVPALAQAPFKIGTILSVTGPSAFLGEDMKRGMEVAIEQINAKGGINGRKIEWVFYDAESQTTKGINATKRLIDQDKVDIIVGGGNNSGIAMAMVPLVEGAKMPFISTEGAMGIVHPVAERQFSFKSTVDDDMVMERLADYFAKRNITNIAMVHDSSGFGQSAVEQLKKVAAARKLNVVYESFNPADTDLTPQLTRVKSSPAQAIICWTVTPAGVVFLKQAHQLGLADRQLVHGYGFVSQRYMQLSGDATRGLLLASVKFPVGDQLPDNDATKPMISELQQLYRKKYNNSEPNQFVAQTYDAIMLAAQALATGGNDKTKIRDALTQIQGFKGAGGTFNFSRERHSGLSKSDLVLLKWEGNRFVLADYQ